MKASKAAKYRYCSMTCRRAADDPHARYWSHIDVRGPNDCWPWSPVGGDGYGTIMIGGRLRRATRYGYAEFVGPIRDDQMVCHHCDNPACMNMSHWFIGSGQDNALDMVAKGRNYVPQLRGVRNPSAKLTDEAVRQMRARYTGKRGEIRALAREFGVNEMTAADVLKGRSWQHID